MAGVCCETACRFGLEGNICGLNPTRLAPLCQSLDLRSDEGTLLYAGCDEGGDCGAGEVCAGDGEDYFVCRPPLAGCAETFGPGCNYACRTSADCPGPSECVLSEVTGPCGAVGFCSAS